ncbi:MAG: HD domain-containing protein [Planctomycetes bacterium]|nr:HD domain-containing protein [Planctomycetota bacterium]
MLDVLRKRYGEESEEYRELEQDRREILVAALLHDVGHGPFSHLFERALKHPKSPPPKYPKDHEGWSRRIIEEQFGDYLRENGVDVSVVLGLIDKKNRRHLLAKDFISSQLDADRMDYLLRDSRSAGPKYGEFALAWLLHSLRIGRVPTTGSTDGVWRLCFDSRKAIHVVEEYIQAREFMYVQVYIHKTTRAYEAMLLSILSLARKICEGDPNRVPSPCPPALAKMLAEQPVTTAEYLSLDDFRLCGTIIDWSQLTDDGDELRGALKRKCDQLINLRQPYKAIDLDTRDKQDKALRLVTSVEGTPLAFSCHRDDFVDRAYRNIHYRKGKEQEEQADWMIHLVDPEGKTSAAEQVSDVIRAISEIETTIYRLYYDAHDPEMIAHLIKEGWLPAPPDNREEVHA